MKISLWKIICSFLRSLINRIFIAYCTSYSVIDFSSLRRRSWTWLANRRSRAQRFILWPFCLRIIATTWTHQITIFTSRSNSYTILTSIKIYSTTEPRCFCYFVFLSFFYFGCENHNQTLNHVLYYLGFNLTLNLSGIYGISPFQIAHFRKVSTFDRKSIQIYENKNVMRSICVSSWKK